MRELLDYAAVEVVVSGVFMNPPPPDNVARSSTVCVPNRHAPVVTHTDRRSSPGLT